MATRSHRPTAADHATAVSIALHGLAQGADTAEIAAQLEPLHVPHDTFPGEVLLELAADAIELADATRSAPLQFAGIRERCLPRTAAHTKAQHHKREFALRAAAMIHGGVDPGLLDEIVWWRTDDLWYWSLEALMAYAGAAAERTGTSIDVIGRRLAELRQVTLDDPSN